MLEIKNLSFSYTKEKTILENINLHIDNGEMIAVKGVAGAGKSTLLLILAGLEKNYTGELYYNDKAVNKNNLKAYNYDNVALIFQNHNLIKYLNIYDNLVQACLIRKQKVDQEKLNHYLKVFNLESINLKDSPSKLSGGQQQRLAIIRALLSNVSIILADEPTASIDEDNAHQVMSELKKLANEENKSILIITHNNETASYADKIYMLENKELLIKNK